MTTRLGNILRRTISSLTEQALDQSAADAAAGGRHIGELLVEREMCSEEQVYRALAEQFDLPFLATLSGSIDEGLMRELPVELFKEGRSFPLGNRDDVLHLAVADPLDLDILMEAELLTAMTCRVSITSPGQMEAARKRYFGEESVLSDSAERIARELGIHAVVDDRELSLKDLRERTESEPIVRLASLIFDQAIRLGASDIHIEPGSHGAVVRFRIDGMLRPHMDLTRGIFLPLTSRIKVLADLDIAEKRSPQDGRIRWEADGSQYDFRVSTLPTHHGEKTVVRVLKHDVSLLNLENLGVPAEEYRQLSEMIEKPQGMLFVTGPTGSGKSSTLFACLNRIRHKPINITTIENPIEYKLEGVNQVQVNEKAGVTFASALRSILRQDPNVVLIGEVRDPETAQIAMQASQTGHLVFSTLHTNDAISAITRLRDLGIPGYLVASSLLGILAQRLVRVLCPRCKHPAQATAELTLRWQAVFGELPLPPFYSAEGCEECGRQGFGGRSGVFELVPFNDLLREMVISNASEVKIRQRVRAAGIHSLISNGVALIEQGITTPDELLRVVLVEDVMQAGGGGA
jgi:type IV pilus assembly protein PilB